MTECDICKHPPIKHVPDGSGSWICLVCEMLVRTGSVFYGQMVIVPCRKQMKFKLTQSEREQAAKADPESFPSHITCGECGFAWMNHLGYLCPSGDSTFIPMLPQGFLVTH